MFSLNLTRMPSPAADPANFEAMFKHAAAMQGEARAAGTRLLERHPADKLQQMMPYFRRMAESPIAPERDLAELLLLWTDRRDEVLAWRAAAAVSHRRDIHPRPEGGIIVRWKADAGNMARTLGHWPLPDEVVITTEAAPVMRALLREGKRGNAIPLMEGSLTSGCVPALIEVMEPGQGDEVIRLISRVAQAADPALCPRCNTPMKTIGGVRRPEPVEFFLRLWGLWAGVINIPPPSLKFVIRNSSFEIPHRRRTSGIIKEGGRPALRNPRQNQATGTTNARHANPWKSRLATAAFWFPASSEFGLWGYFEKIRGF